MSQLSLAERVRVFEETRDTFDEGAAEWTLRRRDARLQEATALIVELQRELEQARARAVVVPAVPPEVGPISRGTSPALALAHVLARADEWYDGDGRGAGPLAASICALRLESNLPTAYAALVALLMPSG